MLSPTSPHDRLSNLYTPVRLGQESGSKPTFFTRRKVPSELRASTTSTQPQSHVVRSLLKNSRLLRSAAITPQLTVSTEQSGKLSGLNDIGLNLLLNKMNASFDHKTGSRPQ